MEANVAYLLSSNQCVLLHVVNNEPSTEAILAQRFSTAGGAAFSQALFELQSR
jgi:hypothetical protein